MNNKLERENDKLPLEQEGEVPMAELQTQCPKCLKENNGNDIRVQVSPNARMRGLITCRLHGDTKLPIAFDRGNAIELSQSLPSYESSRLLGVPADIVQDIEEAQECHFNQTYKAATVMCRRALQLSYEHLLQAELKSEKWIGKLPTLGVLIGIARGSISNKPSERALVLTDTVNELGNDGAHHRVTINPSDVVSAIHDTVVVLNEIYSKKPVEQ